MNNVPNPHFDWNELEKLLGENIPKGLLKDRMNMNAGWVGDYVQKVLKNSFSGSGGGSKETVNETTDSVNFEYEMFETHNSVIVRLQIPEEIQHKNILAYVSSNLLKIEQLPRRKKQIIRLPSLVNPSQSRASYKDRVLEVRMAKHMDEDIFNEIKIRYM